MQKLNDAVCNFILRLPSSQDLLHLRRRPRSRIFESASIGQRCDASVAQSVEQLTLNQLVLGSNPSRGTFDLNPFITNGLNAQNRAKSTPFPSL